MENSIYKIHKIILPVRPQVDTCIAIFLLIEFGNDFFEISNLEIETEKEHLKYSSNEDAWSDGVIMLDLGNGVFDHHNREDKTTATKLVAKYLDIDDDASILKLCEIAERDDFYGKGTLSSDTLDRAFGLPGLLTSLNKTYHNDPGYVVEKIIPLLSAHHSEERQRTHVLPGLVKELEDTNKIVKFTVKQRKKNLKIIIVETSLPSMAGFLRSKIGGAHDVVVQVQETGHTNILTRPTKRIDLRALIVEIRKKELSIKNITKKITNKDLSQYGKIDDVPYWFYDTATNSIQNGGINPKSCEVNHISKSELQEVLKQGLSELNWSPLVKQKEVTKKYRPENKSVNKKGNSNGNDLASLLAQIKI